MCDHVSSEALPIVDCLRLRGAAVEEDDFDLFDTDLPVSSTRASPEKGSIGSDSNEYFATHFSNVSIKNPSSITAKGRAVARAFAYFERPKNASVG